MIIDHKALLLPVFYEMRRMGVPLGVTDYLLAIKTLREGVSVESASAIKRFCRLLWAKSQADQDIFNTAFEKFAEPYLKIFSEQAADPEEELPFDQTIPFQSSVYAQPPQSKEEEQLEQAETEPHIDKREAQVLFHPFYPTQPASQQYSEYLTKKYHFTPRLPIEKREMTTLWRHLRRIKRTGTPEELDIEGTINRITRMGFFVEPLLQPRRHNQARLLLLVDCQGSMAPFSLLIDALIESVFRSGLLRKANVFYYHDCPESFIYASPSLVDPLPLEEILTDFAHNSSVLLVSDAGAARGHYDGLRLGNTKAFIELLQTHTYLYACLNPVPKPKWRATTAEDVARILPMFYLDREGLIDSINILRGHPFPSGVS